MAQTDDTGMFLKLIDAAKLIGVDRQTLRKWAVNETGPPRTRIGKRFYYHREALQQWGRALSGA